MTENQEIIFKLSLLEQQMQQLQQQIQVIEQNLNETDILNCGLDELVGKKDREILASVGRGIFVRAKLLSEELTVDVGGGNFVKKGIPETKKIIDNQIEKLQEVKKELEENLERTGRELNRLIMEAQSNEHVHGPECSHEGE